MTARFPHAMQQSSFRSEGAVRTASSGTQFCAFVAAVFLLACGGGGDSPTEPLSPPELPDGADVRARIEAVQMVLDQPVLAVLGLSGSPSAAVGGANEQPAWMNPPVSGGGMEAAVVADKSVPPEHNGRTYRATNPFTLVRNEDGSLLPGAPANGVRVLMPDPADPANSDLAILDLENASREGERLQGFTATLRTLDGSAVATILSVEGHDGDRRPVRYTEATIMLGTQRIVLSERNWDFGSRQFRTTAEFAGLDWSEHVWPPHDPTLYVDLRLVVGDHELREVESTAADDRWNTILSQRFLDGQLIYEFDYLTGILLRPYGESLPADFFRIVGTVQNSLPYLSLIVSRVSDVVYNLPRW